jgi:hypothetical protein
LITAGGNGHAGKVVLQDTAKRNLIILDGNTGSLVLRDREGNHSFGFHGLTDDVAGLWIGGDETEGKKPGYIAIRDGKGTESITIDGAANTITFSDTFSGNSIVIDGAQEEITLKNADCAEDFEMSDSKEADPGSVMVIATQEGKLEQSTVPYDKKVAGVISGAGDHKPGLVLHRKRSDNNRKPVALMGKVHCKVDAQSSSIEVGDLLTTSSIPGHAMKATDPLRAFGAVIGKALRPLKDGRGIIPVLIALQ